MYRQGLGFEILSEFKDHAGFDGAIVGHRGESYHLEFTARHNHSVGKAPTMDHLLAFYIPDRKGWEHTCEELIAAGFTAVVSYNPYWDIDGRTFEDIDGYRVVLQHSVWQI